MAGFSSPMSRRYDASPLREGDRASRPSDRSSQRQGGFAQKTASAGIDEDGLDRSIRAVERAAETFAALQESCGHYRGLAGELRKAVDDEKEHNRRFAQQLADADRARRADRERADRAERRLDQAARTIEALEQQLAAMRARADRLAQAFDRLSSGGAGRDARAIGDDLADLLAA